MKKRKIKIYILIILIVIAIVILNRSYAYIYDYIGQNDLKNPNSANSYQIKADGYSTSSLKMVAIGDSLSAGVGCTDYHYSFTYQLGQKIAQEKHQTVEFYNYASPGARSQDLINSQIFNAVNDNPDIISVFVGVNDIHGIIPARKFKSNLDDIISYLQNNTKSQIILLNIPYIGSNELIWWPFDWYFGLRTMQYNQIIKGICQKHNIKCVDLYKINKNIKKINNFYSEDKFHPSCAGYLNWSNDIYDSINK